MRLLAVADQEPHIPLDRLVAHHNPDAVVLLGDLLPDWLDPLCRFSDLPIMGVYGNHDDLHKKKLKAIDAKSLTLVLKTTPATTVKRPSPRSVTTPFSTVTPMSAASTLGSQARASSTLSRNCLSVMSTSGLESRSIHR